MGKYGPNTESVEAFLAQLPGLDYAAWAAARAAAWDAEADAAWDAAWAAARAAAWAAERAAAWAAAWAAARAAAWAAARAAAWDAARAAAWAAEALVVRDLITREQFDIITGPMRAAGVTFTEHAMEA
jgi:pimeloyl-ACP methyl ester carboxylesterase